MSWTDSSKMDWLRHVEIMVGDAFTAFRNRGHRRGHAIEMTADALGLTPRRARTFLNEEPASVTAFEREQISRRYLAHLDDQMADLARRSELARARKEQVEREWMI